jgi:hypothetical protein
MGISPGQFVSDSWLRLANRQMEPYTPVIRANQATQFRRALFPNIQSQLIAPTIKEKNKRYGPNVLFPSLIALMHADYTRLSLPKHSRMACE